MNIHNDDINDINDINNINDESSDFLFNNFLNNSSSISYVASGAGGIGLEVVNPENQTYNILSTNNENVVCSKVFIKLIVISDVYPNKKFINNSYSTITDLVQVTLYSSSSTQFIKEVNIQNVIYKKSNSGLESICPPIINAQIHDNNQAKQLIDLLIEKPENNHNFVKNNLLSEVKEKFENNSNFQLGIIAMGFTENYISLHKALIKYPKKKIFFQKLAVYELLRLYNLGYLHGDFSLANILINHDYIYTGQNSEQDKGRAMLIDFGASFPVPTNNNTDLSIREKIDIMLDTPVLYLNNIIPRTYGRKPNNWSWLDNLNNGTALNNMPQLIDTINTYNKVMISMVEEKYPTIYQAVRDFNNDLDYIYVGGNEPTIFKLPLTTSINGNTIKNKNNDIAGLEKIFNPNNYNIQEVGKKYLHTLQMGQESIIQFKNREQKMKKGGKRKTKKFKKTRKSKRKARSKKGGVKTPRRETLTTHKYSRDKRSPKIDRNALLAELLFAVYDHKKDNKESLNRAFPKKYYPDERLRNMPSEEQKEIYDQWRNKEANKRKEQRDRKKISKKKEIDVANILVQWSKKKQSPQSKQIPKQSLNEELQTILDNMNTRSLASNDTEDDIDILSSGTVIDTDSEDDSPPPSRQPFPSHFSPLPIHYSSQPSRPLIRRSQQNQNLCTLQNCSGGKKKTRINKRKQKKCKNKLKRKTHK